MASGSAPRADLPLLQCECRLPSGFERGLLKWSFALLIVSAAALDAFWVMPAERDLRVRTHPIEPFLRKCPGHALARPSPAALQADLRELEHQLALLDRQMAEVDRQLAALPRELVVIDVMLLSPSKVGH